MGSLFWLSDEAWSAIEPHLPKNQPGARRVDDRRVISGIIHMLKCGGRWQDCPSDYGPPTTVYNRWNRWSRRGVWGRILAALSYEGWIAETAQIDSSYVKAHRCDERRYRDRWRVEAMFCRLKDFRRIATRYDKLARNYLSAVALAAAVAFWL